MTWGGLSTRVSTAGLRLISVRGTQYITKSLRSVMSV